MYVYLCRILLTCVCFTTATYIYTYMHTYVIKFSLVYTHTIMPSLPSAYAHDKHTYINAQYTIF